MIESTTLRESLSSAVTPKAHRSTSKSRPKVLFITPEISYVSHRLSTKAKTIRAKAGGLADVSALLTDGLARASCNLHLAIPNYRHLFRSDARVRIGKHIHLAEDSRFYRQPGVYHGSPDDILEAALAFQREVINHIIPTVQPDVVHCHDWMTGLIPAATRKMDIPTIFTIHNIHTRKTRLPHLDYRGIPVQDLWDHLYFTDYPGDFHHTYHNHDLDLLASGIHAADHVSVVSPAFLEEIITGQHDFVPGHIAHLLWQKKQAGSASGIVNAPDARLRPDKDSLLSQRFSPSTHVTGKATNKRVLQERYGLPLDPEAPLLFWPSRLDPVQKGCHLLEEILGDLMSDGVHPRLQLIIIADGPRQGHFRHLAYWQGQGRMVVDDFSEDLSRLAFAGSDFILMPSSFEPCGLPQMIGCRYGALPIAHRTGGLQDTITPLQRDTGNGFLFEYFDGPGFRWAIDQALAFHWQDHATRSCQRERIMHDALTQFSPTRMVEAYRQLYWQVWLKQREDNTICPSSSHERNDASIH